MTFTSAIEKVRQERDGVVTDRDRLTAQHEAFGAAIDCANAKLYALDFALKAMEEQEPAVVEPVAKVRAKRRNIAEMVLQFFIVGSIENATVEAIAREIKCKPGETSAALMRLSKAGRMRLAPGTSDTYQLVKEAVSAAAE